MCDVHPVRMSSFGAALYKKDKGLCALDLRHWITLGLQRRSRPVLCSLFFAATACVLVIAFTYAAGYRLAHSVDPCTIAVLDRDFRKLHPAERPGFVPVLPKIIHQQWKTDTVPEGVYTTLRNKFKGMFPEPEYTHILWTDESARDLIAKEFASFLPTYDAYKFGIQRADAARYFILYSYGGLYADLDYEPLVNFWEHLPTDCVGLVESPYKFNERTQNSLMSSPKGDPFWNATFDLLVDRGHLPLMYSTGPMFLDVVLDSNPEPYHVLPCENFQRYPFFVTEDYTPKLSKYQRDFIGMMHAMKYCGDFHNPECQYGKHHNTQIYLKETGIFEPILAGGIKLESNG